MRSKFVADQATYQPHDTRAKSIPTDHTADQTVNKSIAATAPASSASRSPAKPADRQDALTPRFVCPCLSRAFISKPTTASPRTHQHPTSTPPVPNQHSTNAQPTPHQHPASAYPAFYEHPSSTQTTPLIVCVCLFRLYTFHSGRPFFQAVYILLRIVYIFLLGRVFLLAVYILVWTV